MRLKCRRPSKPNVVATLKPTPQTTTLTIIHGISRRAGAPRTSARAVPKGAPVIRGESRATPTSPYSLETILLRGEAAIARNPLPQAPFQHHDQHYRREVAQGSGYASEDRV